MDISGEIARVEADLKAQGLTVADLCRAAAIARSTWDRWRSGAVVPNLKTWGHVQAVAVALLTPAAPSEDAA